MMNDNLPPADFDDFTPNDGLSQIAEIRKISLECAIRTTIPMADKFPYDNAAPHNIIKLARVYEQYIRHGEG
jgi:hypothetical protein